MIRHDVVSAFRRTWTRSLLVLVVLVAAATVAYGQGDRWYPSRWGAADQRGAANRITPAKVLEANRAACPEPLQAAYEVELQNLRERSLQLQQGQYDSSTRKQMQVESFMMRNSK